jgi:sorbitol-specific phosphotransferase system component IIC
MEQNFHSMMQWLIPMIIILAIWDAVWKLIAMWKAGRNNHLAWFLCIALISTLGILPIVYILMQRKNNNMQQENP